jgi:hypothetical protein
VAAAALVACSDDNETIAPGPVTPVATVFTATGNIAAKVEEFRNALGPSNGGTAGEQPAGRREISWDGAGANPFNNRNDFPADFFNTNVKSGAVFTTAGTGFRNDSTLFVDVNPTYAAEFSAFSPTKIFAPVGSNQLDQLFQVAGQPTPAVVSGFGIVFNDVDVAGRPSNFAQDGLCSHLAAPAPDAAGNSLLSAPFTEAIIARVGSAGHRRACRRQHVSAWLRLRVFDNVIYGEPRKAF